MNELKQYVDGLFSHQRPTASTLDLKEEILGNMEARKNDLMQQGIGEDEAIMAAKESLHSIEGLVEGNQLTDIRQYRLDCLGNCLLWSVVAWIFSIPLLLTDSAQLSFLAMFAVAAIGLSHFLFARHANESVGFVSVAQSARRGKLVWIVWSSAIAVYLAATTAVTFASKVWFSLPITIALSGPNDLLAIALRYYVPLLSVFVPIAASGFTRMLAKNEKRY